MLPTPPPPTTRPPSKALPPVPLVLPPSLARKPVRKPLLAEKTLPSPAPQSQPQTPSTVSTPATPKPQPPLPAPPPSLPALPFETALPPPPPPMSIPRRPVLPPKQNPPAPQPQPKPLPKLQTDLSYKPAGQLQEKSAVSPAESFGSLLSAYSRSSAGDSIVKSSDGLASQRNSESTISPEAHEEAVKSWKSGKDSFAPLPTIPQETRTPQTQQPLRQQPSSERERKALPLPPPPPPPAAKSEPPPPTPKKDSIYVAKAESPVNITNTSPIWRRRSIKADRPPIQLPNLHLASLSHGSTASSQSSAQTTLRTAPLALGAGTLSSQSAKPSNSTDTASSARPWLPPPRTYVSPVDEGHSPAPLVVPSESTPSPTKQFKAYTPPIGQPQTFGNTAPPAAKPTNDAANARTQASAAQDTMGGKQSKLKTQISNFSISKSNREQSQPQPQPQPKPMMATQQHEQPVSPIEAPRLPTPDYQKQDVRPDLAEGVVSPMSPAAPPTPPHDEAKLQPKAPIQRKAVGAAMPQLRPAQSLPQIVTDTSPPLSNGTPSPLPPPSVRDFAPSPGPMPGSPGSYYGGNGFRGGPGPRPSSPASSYGGSIRPRHGPGPGPRPGPAYRPVITDFRELRMEDLPPPDPRALYFPKTVIEPASPDTVFQPFPLAQSHMDCHIGHRIMKPSRNTAYPLACQTCAVADRGERWACSACHVRVCAGCYRTLNANGRSLPQLLEQLQGANSPGQTA